MYVSITKQYHWIKLNFLLLTKPVHSQTCQCLKVHYMKFHLPKTICMSSKYFKHNLMKG